MWASRLAAPLWKKLTGRLQWRLLWLTNPKFIIGVTGAVFDSAGRVLLLRHRYWSGYPWGLPSGYVNRGESAEQGLIREVREETGLQISDVRVAWIRSGYQLRIEVYCIAFCADPRITRLDAVEIESASFVEIDDLPEQLRPKHRELIQHASQESERS